MVPYIIAALIIAYTVFIVFKKVKNIKEGKACGCDCSSCPSKNRCK